MNIGDFVVESARMGRLPRLRLDDRSLEIIQLCL